MKMLPAKGALELLLIFHIFWHIIMMKNFRDMKFEELCH